MASLADRWVNKSTKQHTSRYGQGKRYSVRWVDPNTGKHLSRGFGNREEAKAFKAHIESSMAGSTYRSPELGKVTLTSLADRWLANKAHHLADNGRLYRYIIDKHVKSYFAGRSVASLTTSDIDGFMSYLHEAGHSNWSRHRAFNLVRQVLESARRDRYIIENPCDFASRPPQKTELKVRPLTRSEVDKLAMEAGKWDYFIIFLAYTGLRPSEALALEWSDLDLTGRTVRVNKAIKPTGVVGPTKTDTTRTVGLPQAAVDALRGRESDGRVFPISSLGNWRKRVFNPARKRAGLEDVRLYDLRHTCASWLIERGVESKRLQEWMGHSSIKMTLDTYGHLMDTDPSTVTRLLD